MFGEAGLQNFSCAGTTKNGILGRGVSISYMYIYICVYSIHI